MILQHLIAQARAGVVRGPHLFPLSGQLIGQRLAAIKPVVLIVERAAKGGVPGQTCLARRRPCEAPLARRAARPRTNEARPLGRRLLMMQEGEDSLLLRLLFDLLGDRRLQQIGPDVQSRPLRIPDPAFGQR